MKNSFCRPYCDFQGTAEKYAIQYWLNIVASYLRCHLDGGLDGTLDCILITIFKQIFRVPDCTLCCSPLTLILHVASCMVTVYVYVSVCITHRSLSICKCAGTHTHTHRQSLPHHVAVSLAFVVS